MAACVTQSAFRFFKNKWSLLPLVLVPLTAAIAAALPGGRLRNHSLDPCSHPPPCLLLEKAVCRPELASTDSAGRPTWRARYFDADGSEITCSSDSIVVCEGARRNVSCPPSWTIKVWFAALKPSPASLCDAPARAPSKTAQHRCDGHSVQWELAHMCDGLTFCVINSSALAKDEVCDGRRFLRMEYTCIGSPEAYSPSQTKFFLMAIVAVLSLFVLVLLALLVTVHIKKRRDSYPLTSLHAPLTDYENPEVPEERGQGD